MAWRCHACDGFGERLHIIMVNVIPSDHVDDVAVVEPNQHDDVPIVSKPVLVDEDEDPEEEEFKEEKDPQEKEDDIEVDIKEDKNEPELTYLYEEVDPLNPSPPASELKLKDVSKAEILIEHEDETVPASVYEISSLLRRLCGHKTSHAMVKKKGKTKDEYYGKLILDLGNESTPLTQAAIRQIIKENVNAAIAAERARHVNAGNDARGFGLVREAVELRRWFEKTESVFRISECAEGKSVKFAATTLQGPSLTWWNAKVETIGLETMNKMPWTGMKQLMTAEFCPIKEVQRMEHELWNLLTDNIKGEVTSSKPANLNEAMRMAHKLMEQKSGKGNHRDNSHQTLQNNQKQGNARAMVVTPTDKKVSSGSLHLCERCFTRHVGPCTIKCHKCGNVRHKIRYCKEKNVATGENALLIPTCYDCDEQGHTRNQCPRKVKQEEIREVYGRAYAIKDAEPKSPNVVTGMFLLNNLHAFVLFNSGSDRSFMDTRFNSMLNIDPVKIGASYKVELADGRHAVVIVYGEKVIRIPYGNKMLIVKSDKGVSRLKVISCIKARKYVEQGCHLFLAHVTKNKLKEKQLEDVRVIRDFPEVFLEELPGLPPSSQVEFRIDLVPGAALVSRAPYRLAPSEMRELLVDPAKIKDIKSWAALIMPTKGKQEADAFQTLKQKLCSASIFALPEGTEDFMVYCDASFKSYGAVLMQRENVIAYASRQLKVHEENYTTHDMEL
nr:hypothetical protein [Tanacetum cinerariifolium]